MINFKRAIVIGCPGSGKSTFARQLQKVTDIPLHYLDMLYWNADKTTVSSEKFDERLADILSKGTWIIDGNYGRTMETRIKQCDVIFFLDYPLEICLDGIRDRLGKPREDMPWIETAEDEEFTDFVKSFANDSRPKILELLDKYSYKKIITFHSREEADNFIHFFK